MSQLTTTLSVAALSLTSLAFATSAQTALEETDGVPREPGISLRVYELKTGLSQLRQLVAGQTPNFSVRTDTIDYRDSRGDFGPSWDNFLCEASGFLSVPVDGVYDFRIWSDDGSELIIDGQTVLDNDGLHGEQAQDAPVTLTAGLHEITARMFEATGDAVLRLEWRPPLAADFVVIPKEHLSTRRGEVRVTAPGPKKVIEPLARGRAGDGRPLDSVHPSFTVTSIRPESFAPRVGGIDWLPDGSMLVCTWSADGEVFRLTGTEGNDPDAITVTRIAAGLAEPLGLCTIGHRIFVLQKQELTELIDRDGDQIIDEYRAVCSGWDVSSNFHEFAFGLVERDGFFYANLAIAIDPGGRSTNPQVPDRGSVIRINPRDNSYEVVAHGLRTPNGIGVGAGNRIYITDNQGDWLPVSKVVAYREGAFYGSRAVKGDTVADDPVDPPVVWLPQNEIGNSPSEVAALNVGPWAGQQVHGDVTHGGLKRVSVEEVDGVLQGCVYRFTQGLEAGVNRVRGRGESLYVGGIGSTGNWGQTGKSWTGLERLDYTGGPVFEILEVQARTNGFAIDLTEAAHAMSGNAPGDYEIIRWRYLPTENYGGPRIDETTLDIRALEVSDDRRHIDIELDPADMRPDHVYGIRLVGPWQSDQSRRLWSTEAWYTLNRVPADMVLSLNPAEERPVNVLTDDEATEGFRLLFDGESLEGWRNPQSDGVRDGWSVIDGELVMTGGGGDIITDDEFANFELRLEWAIAPGGNSGIFWRVDEQEPAVWLTGPEMQILDNALHADGANPKTSAGACYALYAPQFDATYPPGRFNDARIIARGPSVEYWLNGELQCELDLDGDDWAERVAASKFADMPRFGTLPRGHIALQDHGDRVRFRNIRIRELP